MALKTVSNDLNSIRKNDLPMLLTNRNKDIILCYAINAKEGKGIILQSHDGNKSGKNCEFFLSECVPYRGEITLSNY